MQPQLHSTHLSSNAWPPACYPHTDPTGEKACMFYKVQSGDSMATIGSVFGITQLDIEVSCG